MKISSFTLPLRDNDGADVSAVHDRAENAILDAFGAFTKVPVSGAWRDEKSGEIYRDESARYEIGADWNPEQRQTLEDLAQSFGHEAGQIAVAVQHGDRLAILDCLSASDIAARNAERTVKTSRRAIAEQYGDIRRTA